VDHLGLEPARGQQHPGAAGVIAAVEMDRHRRVGHAQRIQCRFQQRRVVVVGGCGDGP
jgi:hypothetical protein